MLTPMRDFKPEDVRSYEVMNGDDGTPIAFTATLKDGTPRTIPVGQLDEEGRKFFGISGT